MEIMILTKDLKLKGILLNEDKGLTYCQDRLMLVKKVNGYYHIQKTIDVHEIMPLMK